MIALVLLCVTSGFLATPPPLILTVLSGGIIPLSSVCW